MNICSVCKFRACYSGEAEKFPKGCPGESCSLLQAKDLYNEDENAKIAHNSAIVEKEGYCVKTRIEETADFFHKCGYKKIGFAFCIGLKKEMEVINKYFQKQGFEVHSAVCKCGGIPKEYIKIDDSEKIRPGGFEAMCNPIGQAKYLNECETEYNVVVGLCVGHDSLFIKYSQAPITVLAAKDRVTGHAPLMPVYLIDSYYKRLMQD